MTAARLPVTHCSGEVTNAELRAVSPGSATISLALLGEDGVPVSTVSAPVTVLRQDVAE